VPLPAHIETLAGLWHRFPACKFFGQRHRAPKLGIEFRGAAKLDAVGHEPAPVARACTPAYLLGSPKLTWLPRRIDGWPCAPSSRHILGTHTSAAIIVPAILSGVAPPAPTICATLWPPVSTHGHRCERRTSCIRRWISTPWHAARAAVTGNIEADLL
jgi:hypothetical protein